MLFQILLSILFISVSTAVHFPKPVSELKASQYVGRWYQVYAAPFDFTSRRIERCITMDYKVIQGGNISITNIQLGSPEQSIGNLYYKNILEPGKLTIHLNGNQFDDEPHWVVNLGPNFKNQYQYSVVISPNSPSLTVLTRNIKEFFSLYNQDVKNYLRYYDYVPVVVNQNDCSMIDVK